MNAPAESGPAPAWCLWRNPILRRYCRTRLRLRGAGAMLIITLVIAGFIFAMARTMGLRQLEWAQRYAEQATQGGHLIPIPTMASIERYCLMPLLIFQGVILFLLGTGQVAGGMTAEADEGTMDYMRLSPMTPLSKVFGYLFGLPIREWVMFAATLPFTAWGLWRGEVSPSHWIPVYAVGLCAAVLYHLTGLTAGTVMRNRRWAFLVSMGTVFLLYTIVPQLGNVGLVYFEYLTVWPVLTENLSGLLPESGGAIMKAGQSLMPDVRFFNLGFPESVFTIFSQCILSLTFITMLWRRWRRSESHLLGKAWAAGLSIWFQIVFIGCSVPLISTGLLFVSRRFTMKLRNMGFRPENWEPSLSEALGMVSVYGTVTLLGILVLSLIIAPGQETRARGVRRAARLQLRRVPPFSDEATALPIAVFMSLAGAVGWWLYARQVIGSHWFPGQDIPVWTPLVFAVPLLTATVCGVLLYETRGVKGLFLAVIFVGIVPILAGSVMSVAGSRLSSAPVWVMAASPFVAPTNAVALAIPDALGGQDAIRLASPRAFIFWQALTILAAVRLYVTRNRRKSVPAPPPPPPPVNSDNAPAAAS